MQKYYKYELRVGLLSAITLVLCLPIFFFFYNDFIFTYWGLLIMCLYFVIHELIHGLTFSFFAKNSRNVKYGIVLEKGVLYAMCQELLNKKAAILSLLMPTIILSFIPFIISIFFYNSTLLILGLVNLIGAIGDIVVFLFLIRLPDVQYIDYDNTIGVFLVSKEDLTKYKCFGLKFIESGKHSNDLINKEIKRLYISKPSKWFIGILLAIILISILLTYIP